MKIEITEPANFSNAESNSFALAVEQIGLNGLGIQDHQHEGRDVFLKLGMLANNTSKLTLFPCVTNPLTRHPSVLAALANTLESIAPERTRLIMGAGDQAASHIGRPPASLLEISDAVSVVKNLLSGESVSIGTSKAEKLGNLEAGEIPILISASSPNMLHLAGQKADGVLLMVGSNSKVIQESVKKLLAGAKTANRSIENFKIVHALPTFIDENKENAMKRALPILKFWLSKSRRIFTRYSAEISRSLNRHGSEEEILLESIGLVGTAEECAEKLLALKHEQNIDHVVLQLYGNDFDPFQLLTKIEATILPKVAY